MTNLHLSRAILRLHRIMATLRSPDGCPWDAQQTSQSLKPYLLEEAYEVLEAIDDGNPAEIRDELGDLLLQIVFHAQIFAEEGYFNLADVASAIADKLERRHPHVFATTPTTDVKTLNTQWDRIKAAERTSRGESAGALTGVPPALPALLRGSKLLDRAERQGLQQPLPVETEATIRRHLAGLTEGGPGRGPEQAHEALGELLFAIIQLARSLGLEAEDALRLTLTRFTTRFRRLEEYLAVRGLSTQACPPPELASAWSELVAQERDKFTS